MQKPTPIALALAIAGLTLWLVWGGNTGVAKAPETPTSAIVQIVLPDTLSTNAQIGKAGFKAKCAVCHGSNAVGQNDVAPPLVHKIYEPSHHGDESFQRAVSVGVRQHHWSFGDMPPVEGLTRADVAMIVSYVRELQQANGIN